MIPWIYVPCFSPKWFLCPGSADFIAHFVKLKTRESVISSTLVSWILRMRVNSYPEEYAWMRKEYATIKYTGFQDIWRKAEKHFIFCFLQIVSSLVFLRLVVFYALFLLDLVHFRTPFCNNIKQLCIQFSHLSTYKIFQHFTSSILKTIRYDWTLFLSPNCSLLQ